jgi:HAD superfamily hydrolase (TIGR01509 family)
MPSGKRTLPDAVLWDMDGTLVDTEPYWIECEYDLVNRYGNGGWTDDHAHSIVGFDLRDSARYIQEHGHVDLEVDDIVNMLLDGVIERVRAKVPWRPGARDLLARLVAADVPTALVTMSWRRFADAVVQALPPDSFTTIIAGDEVTHGKPHPEPYRAAARALGVRPRNCVAIEDSPTGVASATAAGCITLAVPHVVDVPDAPTHTTVRSLREVDLPYLRSLTARKRRRDLRPWYASAAVALAAAGIGVAATNGNDEPPPPPLTDVPVQAWAPYWALDTSVGSLAANVATLHEVSPFWYEATGATSIVVNQFTPIDQAAAFLASAKEGNVKVTPSIVDAMPAGGMAAVLADPTTRTQHVDTIVAFARDGDFAGIDIDYEQFAFSDGRGTWATTRPNWVAFIAELGKRLRDDGRTLAVSIPPIYDGERTDASGYWVYDYAAISEHVDQIRIMAYDFSVSESGPIAPLDFVRNSVRAAKDAVDDDSKLILGVALYGRNWLVATSGTCPADAPGAVTNVTQNNIDDLIAKRGVTPARDAFTGEASFGYDVVFEDGATSCTQTRQVHYVDAAGTAERIDLARTERLGGVSLWALGFDGPATWLAIGSMATPNG